jgi:hypothetical protein
MKKIIIWVVIIGVIAMLAIKAISFYNSSIGYEEQLSAVHTDTQNVFSKATKTMTRQGFTLGKYSKDVISAINASIGGRYGEGGAKSAMLWLKEQNPTMDTTLYKQLNQVIEAGYTEFADIQTRKLEIVRAYNVHLKTFPNVVFASALGFPKRDLAKLSAIVTDKNTNQSFETGEEKMDNPFE